MDPRRDSLTLIHLFSDPENLDPTVPEPYSSCGRLAEEVLRRQDNQALQKSFYSLLNEMATSRQFWLDEASGELLGALVHDERLAAKLHSHLNEQAQQKLKAAIG
jgi:hypothetical protein